MLEARSGLFGVDAAVGYGSRQDAQTTRGGEAKDEDGGKVTMLVRCGNGGIGGLCTWA
ncbi:hypothetical protein E4U54_002628, partial [Claviceps lovelessii]